MGFHPFDRFDAIDIVTGKDVSRQTFQRFKGILFCVVAVLEKPVVAENVSSEYPKVLNLLRFRSGVYQQITAKRRINEDIECSRPVENSPGIAVVFVREITFERLAVLNPA